MTVSVVGGGTGASLACTSEVIDSKLGRRIECPWAAEYPDRGWYISGGSRGKASVCCSSWWSSS